MTVYKTFLNKQNNFTESYLLICLIQRNEYKKFALFRARIQWCLSLPPTMLVWVNIFHLLADRVPGFLARHIPILGIRTGTFFNTKNKTRATPEELSESHLFLKPDNWCFGFFETSRHDVIDSCINSSKLCPFTVNKSY